MKTKQLIIPTVAFILALTALFYSHYAIATAFFLYLAVNLFIEVRDTISQLTSKLTDSEVQVFMQRDEIKKLTANREAKKDFEKKQRVKQFELLVEISDLKTQLETAKANSYNEVERKRGREKYNRLYKGKNRSKQEPYTIEGKTIKQLVKENLGIIVEDAGFAELKSGEICGFSAEYAVIGINDSSGWDKNYLGYDILKEYTTYWFAQEEQLIYAIKKHRNIK